MKYDQNSTRTTRFAMILELFPNTHTQFADVQQQQQHRFVG